MSNLIRYIIQEDPEKQMKKNDLDYTKYSTSWDPVQKQSQEDKYEGYKFSSKNLLENSFNSLTSNKSSQSKDEGSFMGGISNIFNNIKSDTKASSNASLPQSIAKTAAEESSKIGNVFSPKSIGNDAASYKIAQNNKGNTANDANIPTNKDLSDDELIETMYPIIKEHENAKPFPYYDTRWNKTVGVGNNINNKKDFYGTNWSVDNMPANKQDIESCLENLEKEKTRIQNERILAGLNPNEHNYKADYFAQFCNTNIDDDTMRQMSTDHIKGDLKSLRKLIPNFDELSLNKKMVLMDYMYNLGPNKFTEKEFPNFIKGARTNNLDLMLKHDHRLGIDERRNIWTDKTLRKDLPNKK